jgi:predicted DNA-binding transcriptional regulator AlpA
MELALPPGGEARWTARVAVDELAAARFMRWGAARAGTRILDDRHDGYLRRGQAPGCSRTAGATGVVGKFNTSRRVGLVNYARLVPADGDERIDPADLLDNREVAQIIGITNPNGVSVYRKRFADFPEPRVEKRQTVLWLRADVEAWAQRHDRKPVA